MKIGGNIVGSVKKNAETIGLALGLFKDGIDPVMDSLTNLPQLHAPDWNLVQSDVMGDLKTPATAYLAGLLLEGVNVPLVGNVSKPLKDAAVAWALGRVALALLYRSTHSTGGSYSKNPYQRNSSPPASYGY